MKKLASILAALSLSLVGTSVFAGGSDCWGNGGADVSTDKIKQEKMDKEAQFFVDREGASPSRQCSIGYM